MTGRDGEDERRQRRDSGGEHESPRGSRRDSFGDHVADVRPLADRDRTRPPPAPESRAPRRPATPQSFVLERHGSALAARAPDVSRAILAELRSGRPAPDREVDLHGLDVDAAQRALAEVLHAALSDRARCLLVIHGHGRRSAGEPVLKASLPEWLQASPDAARIQAFATAPQHLGGAGASLVLLRRHRPG